MFFQKKLQKMNVILFSQQNNFDWGRQFTFFLKKPHNIELQFGEFFTCSGVAIYIKPKYSSDLGRLLDHKWYEIVHFVSATNGAQYVDELRGGIGNSARHLVNKCAETHQIVGDIVVFPLPFCYIDTNGWDFNDSLQALHLEMVQNGCCEIEKIYMRIDVQVKQQPKIRFESTMLANTIQCASTGETVVFETEPMEFSNVELQYVYFLPIQVDGNQKKHFERQFYCVFNIDGSAIAGYSMLNSLREWQNLLCGDGVTAAKLYNMNARLYVPNDAEKLKLRNGDYKKLFITISGLSNTVNLEVQPIFVFDALHENYKKVKETEETVTLESLVERVKKIENAILKV